MKKLAYLLTAVLLLSLLSVPAFAENDRPSSGDGNAPELDTSYINPSDPMPDPEDENAPDVVIVDEEVPLAGGDTQEEGDVVVETPRTEPGTYVRYNDPEEGWTYIPEEEVPLAELPDQLKYIRAESTESDGAGAFVEIKGSVLSTSVSEVDADLGTVYIDASTGNTVAAYNEVLIRGNSIGELASTRQPLELTLDLGVFKFDDAMLETLDALDGDVTLAVYRLEDSSTSAVREEIGAVSVYELRLMKDSQPVAFNGGTIRVTVPYDKASGFAGYVRNSEVVEEIALEVKDGTASWECAHFSTWALYQDSVLDTIVDEATPLAESPSVNVWFIISLILLAALVISWFLLGKRRKNEEKA